LPERVRLVHAPGELRDRELEVLGWRTEAGETALICGLVDGSAGTIPAVGRICSCESSPNRLLVRSARRLAGGCCSSAASG